jgi:uncharacterized protein (TIGR03435 family)
LGLGERTPSETPPGEGSFRQRRLLSIIGKDASQRIFRLAGADGIEAEIRDLAGGSAGDRSRRAAHRQLTRWRSILIDGDHRMLRAVAILWTCAVAGAQTAAPASEFEVASVKLNVYRGPVRRMFRDATARLEISGTRVSTSGNLLMLVACAYGMEPFQVSHGPDFADKWASLEVYDIEARAPGDATPTVAQVREMMQTLLADRFHLRVSRETTVAPVYNLVVALAGPKVQPSTFTDNAPMTRDEGSAGSQIRTRFLNYSMADFVRRIRDQFDRPLLDKTGLTAGFDFSLAYTWQAPGMTAAAAAALGVPDPEPGIPIVASLREQLGLRVVPAKDPVESLVIVHGERPLAN